MGEETPVRHALPGSLVGRLLSAMETYSLFDARGLHGFGIFILSGFPPTRRFGISVVLGTLLTPLSALLVLPLFATFQLPGRVRHFIKRRTTDEKKLLTPNQ